MTSPALSVVIPTCNRPAQLAACLHSLAAQTLPPALFEIIVVDDGGAAPAAPALAPFFSSLPLRHLRQPNAGPAAARNAGAALARGRWLAFTDDDCLPEPAWLQTLHSAFLLHPETLLGGATLNALPANPCSAASQLIQDFAYAYYNASPRHARFFASNNLALPAAAFASLGGFHPAFRTAEDRDLCDRWLASTRPALFLPEARVLHAHRLSLASFCRQHLAYGRGARRFQLAHRRRASRSSIEPAFYLSILRRLPHSLAAQPNPLRTAALLALWQAANTTGWLLETLQSPRNSHASR